MEHLTNFYRSHISYFPFNWFWKEPMFTDRITTGFMSPEFCDRHVCKWSLNKRQQESWCEILFRCWIILSQILSLDRLGVVSVLETTCPSIYVSIWPCVCLFYQLLLTYTSHNLHILMCFIVQISFDLDLDNPRWLGPWAQSLPALFVVVTWYEEKAGWPAAAVCRCCSELAHFFPRNSGK